MLQSSSFKFDWSLINWLIQLNFERYLVKFLAKLAQESEVNKMTPSNIAIVLGPNLLWSKTEGWDDVILVKWVCD